MTKTNTTGDDIITITEALKRLAEQNITPARQSFDAAVKRGKIRKAPESPDGKIRVYWACVLEYIEHGGFKPRGKAGGQSMCTPESPAAQPATSNPDAPGNQCDQGPEKSDSLESEPIKVKTVEPEHANAQTKSEPKARINTKSDPSESKRKGARVQHPAKPGVNAGPNEKNAVVKGRRTQPMRVLKNSLRHLNFDQTKAIRDWADNRLLTVLRPAATADTIAKPNNL